MLKAVFRPNELVPLSDKIVIDSPTNYPELSHYAPVVEEVETLNDAEQYTGPTADDLRREAELFKSRWEEEKERMISGAKAEAENIVQEAQRAAFQEVKRKTDEAQVIKEQAQAEAESIISDARFRAAEIENEIKQSVEAERREAIDKGFEEGRDEGFAEGKAEVDRLIERTQVMLERAQDKRAEILSETEQQIVDLVLLIARKVIKVISENQRDIIVSNVIQALRKVKARGDILIRVNLVDLKLATEHKQEFIKQMEGVNSIQVVEDSTVDPGGCIIETDFGEIDARIASQLAELENRILEISPVKSTIKENIVQPVIRTANLNNDLAASTALINNSIPAYDSDSSEDIELSPAANAALTASAALAALTTMAVKGKRKSDQAIVEAMEKAAERRKSDT